MVVIIPCIIPRSILTISSWLSSPFPLLYWLPALLLFSLLLLPAPVSVNIAVRADTRLWFPVRTKVLVLTIGSIRMVWRVVTTEETAGGGSGYVKVTTTTTTFLNIVEYESI